MAWLIRTDELPPSWPERCVGCGAEGPSGRIKAYGERLKGSIGLAHMFERLCVQLPWCDRCAGRARTLLVVGLALMIGPWPLLVAMSFEPSLGHLVEAETLFTGASVLLVLGVLVLGVRYIYARPVRFVAAKDGIRAVVLRHRGVAQDLARRNGLVAERSLRPRGW